MFDLKITGGTVIDGTGQPGYVGDVAVKDGKIAALGAVASAAATTIDARGRAVTPGFIDLHTHYDAEVELSPALSESLRHGVTSIVLGSCSLSLAIGTAEDLADMFCRVEAIPYRIVRPLLEQRKTWTTTGEYFAHLDQLPLGPNVASFLGHSAMRAHVMGLERSLDRGVRPSADELRRMEVLLETALDEGYLGVSIQTLPWDKMGGSRGIRSRPLPSTYARWSEYRRLSRIVRARDRIFQGVPNISTRINVLLFLLESVGLYRKRLKTTVISMMDVRSSPGIHRVVGMLSRIVNRFLDADFRWQALPEVFDLWADGIDLVVFEEFGAGAAALHFDVPEERARLLSDPSYRARFKRQWRSRFLPKAFHRDFNQSEILQCPDPTVVGKSFAKVAEERGQDAVDVFLDLVGRHGDTLRWYTVMANERVASIEEIVAHPDVLIGFSDAGAHLRNMAHYNFPLRMLRLVREAERRGQPFMSTTRAVHRLTGEIGQWLGLDAGVLEVGKRADLAVIDPEALDDRVEQTAEAPVEGFEGFVRLVRRNDDAVTAVLVNGRLAVRSGQVLPEVGRERGFGKVLRTST